MEILLIVTSLIFLISAGYFYFCKELNPQFKQTNTSILLTASFVYAYMGFIYAGDQDVIIRAWRYLDWLITVPLLLTELYLFLDKKLRQKKDLTLIVIFSSIMLGLGLLGELHYLNKWIANIIGSGFGVGLFYILFKKIPKKHLKFLKSVAILWLFYPIVYVIEDSVLTLVLFSIVDLLAKVGVAFYIKSQEKYLENT